MIRKSKQFWLHDNYWIVVLIHTYTRHSVYERVNSIILRKSKKLIATIIQMRPEAAFDDAIEEKE